MGGQELVLGRSSSPSACHADPRWQAASQSSHPFTHCLTVLVLHLAQQPRLTEEGFFKSGRVGGGLAGLKHIHCVLAFVGLFVALAISILPIFIFALFVALVDL